MFRNIKTLVITLSIIVITAPSFGGGKCGKRGCGGGTCQTKTIPLKLNRSNINPSALSGRNPFFPNFQPENSNILNGVQPTSAASLFQFIEEMNYCFITITSVHCTNYGDNGTKTYIWDSTNNGVPNDRTMNIEVPATEDYTITIDLHETCGPYYNNISAGRALWIHQDTYPQRLTIIVVNDWMFNRINQC